MPLDSAYAYIDWLPNQESDLAGYYVEMAYSGNGPWKRVTQNPIAWWETHYDARIWKKILPLTGYAYDHGPPCVVLRVIAVDEAGNESVPSDSLHVQPFDEDLFPNVPQSDCPTSPPPVAPTNLTAGPGADPGSETTCTTLLQWEAPVVPPGTPLAYRIYRFIFDLGSHHQQHRFYVTHQTAYFGPTECQDSDGDGMLECSYVEEGDPDNVCPLCGSQCPGDQNCELGTLEAYYVTAYNGRESMRSNVVFWDCGEIPGYAKLELDERERLVEQIYDAVAANEVEAGSLEEVPWCEDNSMLPSVGECEASPVNASGQSSIEVARVDGTLPLLTAAPMFTLGQMAPEVPDIYDLHVDHLGSVRFVTQDGLESSRHDFFPFGKEIAPIFDYNKQLFTGHERDSETGLDYMLARYYGSSISRFLSVDPLSGSPIDPKTWNRYSYVDNNPVLFRDPFGLTKILGIHSNVGPDAGFTGGHAWISVHDTDTGAANTYGLWPDEHQLAPDNGDGSDVRHGLERGSAAKHSRYYELSDEEADRLDQELVKNDAWRYTNTCASWASCVVRKVTGEDVDADDLFGLETPREISRSINKLEKDDPTSPGKPKKPEADGGSSSSKNNYGVDPDGFGPAPNPCRGLGPLCK